MGWFDNLGGSDREGNTAEGLADWAAGSTDEFIGRTFDDTEGGGAGDLSAWYDGAARAGDRAAGVLDEGVGGLTSLVDSEPGNTAGAGTSQWSVARFAAQLTDNPTNPDDSSNKAWVLLALLAGAAALLAGGASNA